MKALCYYPSVPAYLLAKVLKKSYPVGLLPLRLRDIPEPEYLPDWKRIKVRMCGICGSDLALMYGKNSPRLSGFFSFPAVPGHEILGETDGKRVVVNPCLACRERSLEPCEACRNGEEHLCLNVAEGQFSAGMLGFCRDLPGGWSETIAVHPAKIHEVPDDVPDERAVLAEPLAVVLRGLRNVDLKSDKSVLIIGAGTIGLMAIKLLRTLGYKGEMNVLARYLKQRTLALEFGADKVCENTLEAAAGIGAKAYKSIIGPTGSRGGFDVVIDAAGSKVSLDQASWAVREGGKLILLGSPGEMKHNFAPYWFREVKLLGSYIYSNEDFIKAVAMLPKLKGAEKLVTHAFKLSDWRQAIRTVVHRDGIKVVFTPQHPQAITEANQGVSQLVNEYVTGSN
ncbi:zinc-binding dehydrogenase [candidate division WOR-3 bacterium]|nr:zinc-binding dehydrogenase [candidate division WOR-3 bacterium]